MFLRKASPPAPATPTTQPEPRLVTWNDPALADWYCRNRASFPMAQMEIPELLRIIGDVKGKTVLSIGCAGGELELMLHDRGAKLVVGVDSSESMIALHARPERDKRGISKEEVKFKIADVTNVDKLEGVPKLYDVVVCSMLLNNVEDLDGALAAINNVLKVGGILAISIPHPIATAAEKKDVEKGWLIHDYLNVRKRTSTYTDKKEGVSFLVEYYHRPEHLYMQALAKGGFRLDEILTPVPGPDVKPRDEGDRKRIEERRRLPSLLIMRAVCDS